MSKNRDAAPEAPRARVLREAGEAVLVDRANTYGPPEDSFKAIAELWSGYLKARWSEAPSLTPLDACNLMELLKIARSVSNPTHFDNYVDRAGYAACAADLMGPFLNNVIREDIGLTPEEIAHLDTLEGE